MSLRDHKHLVSIYIIANACPEQCLPVLRQAFPIRLVLRGALKGTFIGRPPHRTRGSCHRETYHTWHAYTTGPLLEEPALALYSDTVPPIHCRMHPLLASRAGNMVSPETAPCRDTRHTDIPASCRRPRTSKDSKHPCHSGAVQSSASRYN